MLICLLFLCSCGGSSDENIIQKDGLRIQLVGEIQKDEQERMMQVIEHHGVITGKPRHAMVWTDGESVTFNMILSDGVDPDSIPSSLMQNLRSLQGDLDVFAFRGKDVTVQLCDGNYSPKIEIR